MHNAKCAIFSGSYSQNKFFSSEVFVHRIINVAFYLYNVTTVTSFGTLGWNRYWHDYRNDIPTKWMCTMWAAGTEKRLVIQKSTGIKTACHRPGIIVPVNPFLFTMG